MTRAELLEVVYRFYPRGLHTYSREYNDTDERQRQRDAARRGVAEAPTWKAMLRRLRARHGSIMDHTGYLLSGGYDPAYSAVIYVPGGELYFHVSLLGPYYGIHHTGAPGEEPAALDLAREIEATYPGHEAIPPELGDQVVPDVSLDKRLFGKATIYECLLSELWAWGSGNQSEHALPTDAEVEAAHRALAAARRSGLVSELRPRGAEGSPDDDPDADPEEPRQ